MSYNASVLVVEDQKTWQELLESVLRDEGHEVDISTNLSDALDALDRKYYDLAVLDVRLDEADPDNEDGLSVLRHVARSSDDTRAIMLTGHADVPND